MVIAKSDKGLQLTQARVDRVQAAEPVAVGAQVVSQLVTVTRVGFRSRGAPARPGRMESGGVHRHNRMPGSQEPVNDQTAAAFDMTGSCAGSSRWPSLHSAAATPCEAEGGIKFFVSGTDWTVQ